MLCLHVHFELFLLLAYHTFLFAFNFQSCSLSAVPPPLKMEQPQTVRDQMGNSPLLKIGWTGYTKPPVSD